MHHATLSSTDETIALHERYVVGNYRRYPVVLTRGEGSYVWDAEGVRYLDFFPGWGCNILGHCPPRVVEAVRDQLGTLIHVPNSWHMETQGRWARALSERSFGGKAFFCNSGAEANEVAIKLARAYGHAQGRTEVVTMTNGFHGRTYGALSATAQPKYHEGFGPMVPGFRYVQHNSLEAAAEAVNERTAAVMLEPIQGEGGINLPAPGYLAGLRKLCDERGALLILDEVQTGLGRTGKWFAYQHYDAVPDILTCAKALAAGLAAGVLLARAEVADALKPGMHGSTFGGNPIACRAGLAAIEAIEEDDLLDRGTAIGERFRGHLDRLQSELPGVVWDVRIRGAMIGVELSADAAPVVARCLEKGLLVNATHGTVLRLLPALTLTDEQLDEGCALLAEAVREVGGPA